jgi:hypothetical protein
MTGSLLVLAAAFCMVAVCLWARGPVGVLTVGATCALAVAALLSDTDLASLGFSGQDSVGLVRVGVVVCCLWIAMFALILKSSRRESRRQFGIPLLLLGSYATLSFGMSLVDGGSSAGRAVFLLPPVAIGFACVRLGRTELPVLVSAALSTAICLFEVTLGRGYVPEFQGRLGSLVHPNALGFHAAIAVVVGLCFLLGAGRDVRRLMAGVAILCVGVFAGLGAGSRTGLIAALLAVVVTFLRSSYSGQGTADSVRARALLMTAVASIAAITVFIMVAGPSNELGSQFDRSSRSDVLTGRGELWGSVLDLIAERPVFGYGVGALRSGGAVQSSVSSAAGWSGGGSHNALLEASLSAGVVAGALWLAALVLIVRSAIRRSGAYGALLLALSVLVAATSLTEAGPAGLSSAWFLMVALSVATSSDSLRARRLFGSRESRRQTVPGLAPAEPSQEAGLTR